jgi:two-component system cell cycle response regulator
VIMKVLIVEDDPVTRRLLDVFLGDWGYDVSLACDGREACKILWGPEAPNLVVSDWMMPYMNGLELCQKVRQTGGSHYIYFIILTAKDKKKDVIEALEAGADDYVLKPFDKAELKCRIQIGERILDLEHRILELARTDFLTGVLNRRAFVERMEQELHRAVRERNCLSLILADIDSFKKINDEYGHNSGDRVLQEFTKALSGCLRAYDFIGRHGGEEFLVCLPGANESQAKLIAERMRRKIEQLRIGLPEPSGFIQITASFGVAFRVIGSDETIHSMTRQADEAMYRAKRAGKNRVFAAPSE